MIASAPAFTRTASVDSTQRRSGGTPVRRGGCPSRGSRRECAIARRTVTCARPLTLAACSGGGEDPPPDVENPPAGPVVPGRPRHLVQLLRAGRRVERPRTGRGRPGRLERSSTARATASRPGSRRTRRASPTASGQAATCPAPAGRTSRPIAAANGFYPKIAIDPGGHALAVWYELAPALPIGTGYSVSGNRYTVGNGWTASERIGEYGDLIGTNMPNLAMDPNGDAFAIWTRAGEVWVNRFE